MKKERIYNTAKEKKKKRCILDMWNPRIFKQNLSHKKDSQIVSHMSTKDAHDRDIPPDS